MIKFQQRTLNDQPLPLVWEVTQGKDAPIEAVVAWLREHKSALGAVLDRQGGVLLRGFEAINSAQRFGAVLDVVAPELMDYIGGTAPRRAVHGRILTANDLPENYTLALHQEMAYTDNPPDALAFFCEIPAAAGGETTVADARLVTSRLDRSVLARFEAKGVGIRRTLPTPESLAKKPGIPKAWTDVFETTDRDEVERIARDRGWTVSWLPDNSVQLWQALLPGFRSHPRTGERVWFNQVHYHSPECTLRWAERDGRLDQVAQIKQAIVDYPEMLDYAFHSDGTRVSADDANHIWDVIEQSEIPVSWRAGDVLLLDNILAMHGRRSFRGTRRILAAMIRDRPPAAVQAMTRQRETAI